MWEFVAHSELKPAACSSDSFQAKFRQKVDVSRRYIRKEQWDFTQPMAFKIKQAPSFLWLRTLRSMTWYGPGTVQGVRHLTAISKSGQVMKGTICLGKAVSTYLVFLKEHMAY